MSDFPQWDDKDFPGHKITPQKNGFLFEMPLDDDIESYTLRMDDDESVHIHPWVQQFCVKRCNTAVINVLYKQVIDCFAIAVQEKVQKKTGDAMKNLHLALNQFHAKCASYYGIGESGFSMQRMAVDIGLLACRSKYWNHIIVHVLGSSTNLYTLLTTPSETVWHDVTDVQFSADSDYEGDVDNDGNLRSGVDRRKKLAWNAMQKLVVNLREEVRHAREKSHLLSDAFFRGNHIKHISAFQFTGPVQTDSDDDEELPVPEIHQAHAAVEVIEDPPVDQAVQAVEVIEDLPVDQAVQAVEVIEDPPVAQPVVQVVKKTPDAGEKITPKESVLKKAVAVKEGSGIVKNKSEPAEIKLTHSKQVCDILQEYKDKGSGLSDAKMKVVKLFVKAMAKHIHDTGTLALQALKYAFNGKNITSNKTLHLAIAQFMDLTYAGPVKTSKPSKSPPKGDGAGAE